MKFYTADWHLGHANIIKYEKRPFKDMDDMCSSLARRCSERAGLEDTMYHIGDFLCYGRERGVEGDRLRSWDYENTIIPKVVHILGNHDRGNKLKDGLVSAMIRDGGLNIFMAHKPDEIAPSNTDLYLCGHVHSKWRITKIDGLVRYNVGVDANNFYPVTMRDIQKNIKKAGYKL